MMESQSSLNPTGESTNSEVNEPVTQQNESGSVSRNKETPAKRQKKLTSQVWILFDRKEKGPGQNQ